MSRKLNMTNTALLGRASARASSLFGIDDGRSLREIDMDRIVANPRQPRRRFDEASLATLADSIDRHGLLQPICVREVAADQYQIVSGERRFRAMQALGRQTIPAVVTRTDDPATLALIENIQREDLDPLELATALAELLNERGATHEQLGALIGKSQAYISRMLGVLSLPQKVKNEYADHRYVPASALMVIAEAKGAAMQEALWEKAKNGASVRALLDSRDAAKDGGDETAPRSPPRAPSAERTLRSLRAGTDTLLRLYGEDRRPTQEQTDILRALRDDIDALLAR